jgi:hypothetical protein
MFLAICYCLLIHLPVYPQGEATRTDQLLRLPSSFLDKVNQSTIRIEQRLTKQTQKYLQRLASNEARLKRKMQRLDSSAAKNCFAEDPLKQYNAYLQKLVTDSGTTVMSGEYIPYLDSLQSSLSFLTKLPGASNIPQKDLQQALGNLQRLQSKMQQAQQIKQFIQQRKDQIRNYLSHQTHLPKSLSSAFKNYSKEAYYYGQQVKEYKDLLNNPDKAVKTVLKVLNKLPAFTGFMKKHSMLASLFNMPGAGDMASVDQMVAGLQTRSQVMTAVQSQFGTTGPNVNRMIQQNLQATQGQLNQLRERLKSLGGGNDDLDMPDFKPNNQKTKSFFQRLEYGTNIQSAQSNSFFPTTTDLGLSVGYKVTDKSTVGVGASYKMGWGKSIRHITLTHEGMGVRSFLDVKLKGSFYASGGLEYNYQPMTVDSTVAVRVVQDGRSWQQSGLIGVSKILSLKSNVFKKTRMQLLWDFLSYQQRPQTQAFRFRIGYNF